MNKFSLNIMPYKDKNSNIIPVNEEYPVLYKIQVGKNGKYYVHKGKILSDSAKRFLDDVDRGIRGKGCPKEYSNVVEYCIKFPAIHSVSAEVILNAEPDKILKKEASLYKIMKTDDLSLNRTDLEPYKPEWMVKQSLQKRCENPILEGIVNGKKLKFKFCPNCGRLNKEAKTQIQATS